MNPGQLNPWLALQDVIGPASTFPRFIRRLFRKRELYNRERFTIAVFGWMNGVHPEFLVEVLIFCGCNLTADRQDHIGYIYRQLDCNSDFRGRYRA